VSKEQPKLKEDISPNVVPMIDIMFLLLLFFMLGADMAQRESVDMVLPLADQIKEQKENEEVPTTTVNVHHDPNLDCKINDSAENGCREKGHWIWSVRGITHTAETLKTQLQIDADEFLEDSDTPGAGKKLSAKKLLIRADGKAPYGEIQRVIEIGGGVGMYKVEVAGAKPSAAP
jgi:biopolymer transport protein ExbD